MKRRSFLQRGLLGGLLLAAGGGIGLGLWPSAAGARPRRKLLALDEREFAILGAIAARTLAGTAADAVEIAHGVDAQMALAVPEARGDFKRLLRLFDNALAGLLFDGHLGPFTRLDAAAQDAVLESWRRSRVALRRSGYTVLRKITQAVWYAAPPAWAAIGYPGPPQIQLAAVPTPPPAGAPAVPAPAAPAPAAKVNP